MAMPQRDNPPTPRLRRTSVIRRRSVSYGGQVEEIKRLDALLEYAVQHDDEADAERIREELKRLTDSI